MKTRWEFRFKSIDVIFSKRYVFTGKGEPLPEYANKVPAIEFKAEIIPDKINDPKINDTGKIFITLSGSPETTESTVNTVLINLVEKLSYTNGKIEIHSGFITAKRIPETSEEEVEIGDNPYFAKLSFQEVTPTPEFNPQKINMLTVEPKDFVILQQFNAAKELINPIDRFVAFFKVLEKLFADERRSNVFNTLAKNQELLEAIFKFNANGNLTGIQIIQNWLKVRDNCAHFRGSTGYSQTDSRIKSEVIPSLNLLEVVLDFCLKKKFLNEK